MARSAQDYWGGSGPSSGPGGSSGSVGQGGLGGSAGSGGRSAGGGNASGHSSSGRGSDPRGGYDDPYGGFSPNSSVGSGGGSRGGTNDGGNSASSSSGSRGGGVGRSDAGAAPSAPSGSRGGSGSDTRSGDNYGGSPNVNGAGGAPSIGGGQVGDGLGSRSSRGLGVGLNQDARTGQIGRGLGSRSQGYQQAAGSMLSVGIGSLDGRGSRNISTGRNWFDDRMAEVSFGRSLASTGQLDRDLETDVAFGRRSIDDAVAEQTARDSQPNSQATDAQMRAGYTEAAKSGMTHARSEGRNVVRVPANSRRIVSGVSNRGSRESLEDDLAAQRDMARSLATTGQRTGFDRSRFGLTVEQVPPSTPLEMYASLRSVPAEGINVLEETAPALPSTAPPSTAKRAPDQPLAYTSEEEVTELDPIVVRTGGSAPADVPVPEITGSYGPGDPWSGMREANRGLGLGGQIVAGAIDTGLGLIPGVGVVALATRLASGKTIGQALVEGAHAEIDEWVSENQLEGSDLEPYQLPELYSSAPPEPEADANTPALSYDPEDPGRFARIYLSGQSNPSPSVRWGRPAL